MLWLLVLLACSLRCVMLLSLSALCSRVCSFRPSCLPLSFRVHAPGHRSLSRKPPGLTDAAYAREPNTLASLVFVSILARERPL
jgi:hypothetical protein